MRDLSLMLTNVDGAEFSTGKRHIEIIALILRLVRRKLLRLYGETNTRKQTLVTVSINESKSPPYKPQN